MTALRRGELARLLDRWDSSIRLLLLAGPDESASREQAAQALRRLADPADAMSVTDIAADSLKSDPGLLADEAASISMFGGARAIRVTGAGDGAAAAARLLLDAPAAGNPVVMLAGDLPKSSALRKLATESALARLQLNYLPDMRDAGRWLEERARELGLTLERGIAQRLLESVDLDIGIAGQELEKYALFLNASPDAPQRLGSEALASLGADSAEEDIGALIIAVTSGDRALLDRQLALLSGGSSIPALRAMARRLMQLLQARAALDSGRPPSVAVKAVKPPLFWKDEELVANALNDWPVDRCRAGLSALLAAEQAIKTVSSAGDPLGWQTLLRLAISGSSLGRQRRSS